MQAQGGESSQVAGGLELEHTNYPLAGGNCGGGAAGDVTDKGYVVVPEQQQKHWVHG